MPNLMYMEMGMNVINGIGKFLVGSEQAKLDKAMRRHRETMSALSAAQSMNAITRNQIGTVEANIFADASVQSASLQEQADFNVEAAAAGVIGGSIDVGRSQLVADAARAQTSRKRSFKYEGLGLAQQRKNVELQKIYARDITPIQRPSLGAAFMGITQNLIDTWDRNNPADRRSTAALAE